MNLLTTAPLHLLVAAGSLFCLVLAFLAFFLAPGILHWFRLRGLQSQLARFEGRTPPGDFRKVFAKDRRLAHLWSEYQDSLHVQREERDEKLVAVAVRSTVPAETFFNSQYVVDARLRTEFFKHVPGIFTGIGIIGTFSGLIEGLRQFQVSENAATVRASLESLMHSVGQAFLISASAIAAAMIVTFLEKLLLASLYGRIEEIAHAIDAHFDAGAGEDYLSRLVKASEDSAAQSKTLKTALVHELGEVLRELTTAQIAAAREDAEKLGATIAASIAQGLSDRLQASAGNVMRASEERNAERTEGAIAAMTTAIDATLQEMSRASAQMARCVDGLAQTTTTSLDQMNAGADRISAASRALAQAGEQVSGSIAQAAELSSGCTESSRLLAAGAQAMHDVIGDYRLQRDAMGHVVTELRACVDLARREASLTAEVLGRIQHSTDRLGEAQQQTDRYLGGVSQVLGDSHRAFALAMHNTLGLANTEFHTQLSSAVGLLSSTIVELEATLGNVAPARELARVQ
jgi:hypothetical protein